MSATVGLWEHFRRLASFHGREDRSSFWPYAAVAFALVTFSGVVTVIPMAARMMRSMQGYAMQHPDEVLVTSAPGQYSMSVNGGPAGLMPSPDFIALYLAMTVGLGIVLYAAAVARRLHDCGRSGAWGLMPLPFILYSSIQFPRLFGMMARGAEPGVTTLLSIALSNALYLLAVVVLIVLLAGASDPQPNRYDRSVG